MFSQNINKFLANWIDNKIPNFQLLFPRVRHKKFALKTQQRLLVLVVTANYHIYLQYYHYLFNLTQYGPTLHNESTEKIWTDHNPFTAMTSTFSFSNLFPFIGWHVQCPPDTCSEECTIQPHLRFNCRPLQHTDTIDELIITANVQRCLLLFKPGRTQMY